ncbi:hypothetical protein [Paludifilum halophilum]|nr:hypothetical protein [Paludifilum halophilum]
MARLEYRLDHSENGYPVLYYYEPIDAEEISTRMVCDYFVKGKRVYEKISCTAGRNQSVILVREAEEEEVLSSEILQRPEWSGLRLEVREFREEAVYYPVVQTMHFSDADHLRTYLQSDAFDVNGRPWQKTSAEIDENRRVYVLYAIPISEGGSR